MRYSGCTRLPPFTLIPPCADSWSCRIQNDYEVTTEDKVKPENLPPTQISLTDCLACSGCVTSAEAVLISLQSHAEVLNTLDSCREIQLTDQTTTVAGKSGQKSGGRHGDYPSDGLHGVCENTKLF